MNCAGSSRAFRQVERRAPVTRVPLHLRDIRCTSPRHRAIAAHGSKAVVTYGQGTEGGGIALRSKYGFEVCAKDCEAGFALNSAAGPFVNATITGSTKTTVTIAAPAGFEGKVVMVRYGWDDMPSLFYGTQIAVCELRTPFAFRAAAWLGWPPAARAPLMVLRVADNAEGIPANPGAWNVSAA